MADGRHSPPCVRNTFGHSGLELPCKSHHTVDLHNPAAWTLWLNIIKSCNQVRNTNLSSKTANWASKNSHKTCQKHVLLIFDPKNQKERKGYFFNKMNVNIFTLRQKKISFLLTNNEDVFKLQSICLVVCVLLPLSWLSKKLNIVFQ